MPANEIWVNDTTILVEWCEPVTAGDLNASFNRIAKQIDDSDEPVDIMFWYFAGRSYSRRSAHDGDPRRVS